MPAPESLGRSRPRHDPARRGRRAVDRLGEAFVQWAGGAPMSLALVDTEGSIDWVNPAFERFTGFDLGAAVGMRIQALLDGPLAAPWPRGGEAERRTLHARDGRELVCDVHAAPSGEDRWMVTLVERRSEAALQQDVNRLEGLLDFLQDSAHIGVWERDIRTQQGHWDPHMFRFWGLDPSGGAPTMVAAARATVPQDELLGALSRSQSQPGRHTHRFRLIGPEGEVRRARAHWEVRTTPDGTPDRVVGLVMDDTETYSLASSLDQANAQLQLAVDLADLVVWRHDLVTGHIRFNARGYRLLDFDPSEDGPHVDAVRARIHPDDLPEVVASHQRALEAPGTWDMQARYRRRDGTWAHLLTRRVAQRDSQGQPVAFNGVALDITDQVERSQRAIELSRQLEDVAATSGIGVWRISADGQRAEWNAQMYALFGLSPHEPPPLPEDWATRCVHPADRDRVLAAALTWMRSAGPATELAHRVLLADGRVRHVVVRGRFEPPGGPYRVAGVAIDVTERELALRALQDATERAALVTRAAGIGTWEWDSVSQVSRWDPQMYRLRGIEPRTGAAPSFEEMLGFVHPEDREHVARMVERALEDQDAVLNHEFRIVRPDGAVRRIASRSKTVRDEGGVVKRRLGVNWDVTDAREAEAAQQQRALAQRESQAKSELLARMSHELRTPMNAILGFTHLLLADDVEPGTTRHLRLEHIRSAGEHLLTLINNVLELSRLDGSDTQVVLQPVRLGPLVLQTLPLIERLAHEHDVRVTAAPTPLLVRADATRLKQVLVNLLTNAIKYNRPKGEVRIEANADAEGRVVLRVSDTGVGMTPEQQALAFEPFNRAGAERRDIEGTGIGLTIVKALVERMGGRLALRSAPGEGSIFEVILDAARPMDTAPGGGPRPRRLLYIEDNPVNVLIVHELVRRRGDLEFETTHDGTSGVEQATRTPPGLVLVDMQLPDIEGLEVLRRLRANPATATLPCIALSANAIPGDIERALQAGFDDYWTKPLDFEVFRAALDRVFGAA
jgi:signal transduction histidine kinase